MVICRSIACFRLRSIGVSFEKVTGAKEEVVPVGKSESGKTVWRCIICGYEFEADELPDGFTCPICGVDASNFEKV